MNAVTSSRTQTHMTMALLAGAVVAAMIMALPAAMLDGLLSAVGMSALLEATPRAALAAVTGLLTGLTIWIALNLLWPGDDVSDDYDVFQVDAPVLRPIFASTDLGTPFNSIRADRWDALPFEHEPIAAGDEAVMGESGRLLWEPDPWFDELQDPEPALIEPVRWGAPVLEAKPIASLSLNELVARLESGLRRRRAMAAAAPIPIRTPKPAPTPTPFSPMQDMDDALRDALGTLQRLAARSA